MKLKSESHPIYYPLKIKYDLCAFKDLIDISYAMHYSKNYGKFDTD